VWELAAPVGVSLSDVLVAPARRGIVTATFTLFDGVDLGATPYPTHLGLDVMTDATVLRQPPKESVAQTVEMIDNGFGPLVIEPVRSYLRRRSTITLVDHGAAARWAERRWLHALRGRQNAFWLPGWGHELVLQASLTASATSMVVAPIAGLAAYIGRHVIFDLPSGGIFREITNATFDALGHRLDIAAPDVAVPLETPVHFLTSVRFDTDRAELEHTATRTEMNVAVIEVPA